MNADLTPGRHRGHVCIPGDENRGCAKGTQCRDTPLDIEQAAQYLNVTVRFMRRLVAERRVAYLKVGRFVRFRPADLDTYIENCAVPVPTRTSRAR